MYERYLRSLRKGPFLPRSRFVVVPNRTPVHNGDVVGTSRSKHPSPRVEAVLLDALMKCVSRSADVERSPGGGCHIRRISAIVVVLVEWNPERNNWIRPIRDPVGGVGAPSFPDERKSANGNCRNIQGAANEIHGGLPDRPRRFVWPIALELVFVWVVFFFLIADLICN